MEESNPVDWAQVLSLVTQLATLVAVLLPLLSHAAVQAQKEKK